MNTRDLILEIASQLAAPVTADEIAGRIGLAPTTVAQHLNELVRLGKLSRTWKLELPNDENPRLSRTRAFVLAKNRIYFAQ